MNHYKVLGLSKNANKAEIKEAFRKLALKFHPDKHSQSSQFVRDNAILRFKQASEAYEVLIDDRKRDDYNQRFGGGGGGFRSGYGYKHSYYSVKNESGYNYKHRSSVPNTDEWGFDFEVALRFVTRRGFLLNLSFASVLLGAAIVIERSGETLWKMHNSGKSFEEAMESIEKIKKKKDTR